MTVKSKAGKIYRQLPRVPTTKFLSPQEVSIDILFSGYRPIVSPVRDNPLFQAKFKELESEQREREQKAVAEAHAKAKAQEESEFPSMAGPLGTGGVKSGGVNGAWRYNPRIPNKLMQNALWASSCMGMEYYPEWNDVPSKVSASLKPFQLDRAAELNKKKKKSRSSLELPQKHAEELRDEKAIDQLEQVVQQYLQQWKQK